MKAYLDGFLKPGCAQLRCYGRNGKTFLKSPDELGKQRNFYSLRNEDGSWDDSLEKSIEATIEVPGLPVIEKLARGKTKLSWKERNAIALFIGFQETRTPSARSRARVFSAALNTRIFTEVRNADPEQKSIKLGAGDGSVSEVSLDEIERNHQTICDDHSKPIHRALIQQAFALQAIYSQMKFTIYRTQSSRFVTTDNPVVKVFHSGGFGADIMREDVEIRFPLSSSVLLTLTHDLPRLAAIGAAKGARQARLVKELPATRTIYANDAQVLYFNRGNVRHALSWVFTSDTSDWVSEVLASPVLTPTIADLSTHDIVHFQTQVNYNPAMDRSDALK